MARMEGFLFRGNRLLWGVAAYLFAFASAAGWVTSRILGVSEVESAASAEALQALLQAHVAILAVLLPVVLLVLQMSERGTFTAVGFVHAADKRFRLAWLFVAGTWLAARLAIDGVWLTHPWMVVFDLLLFALFLVYVSLLLIWAIAGLANPSRRRELALGVLHDQLAEAQTRSRQILEQREDFDAAASKAGVAVQAATRYARGGASVIPVPATAAGVVGRINLKRLSHLVEDLELRAGLTSGAAPTLLDGSDLQTIRAVLYVRPGDRVSRDAPVALLENLSPSSVPVDEVVRDVFACISFDAEAAAVADRVSDLLDTAVDHTERAIREGSAHRAIRGLETLREVLRWSLDSSGGAPPDVATAGFTGTWFFETLDSLSVALEGSPARSMAKPVVSAYLDFAHLWEKWQFTDEASRVLRAALRVAHGAGVPSTLESVAVFVSSTGLGVHRSPDRAWQWSKKYASLVKDALEASDRTATALLARAGEQVTGWIDPPTIQGTLAGTRRAVSHLEENLPEAQAAMVLSATRLFLSGWERVARAEDVDHDSWLEPLAGPGNAYDLPGLSVLELALSDDFQSRLGAEHWEIFSWGPFAGVGFLTLDAKIVSSFVSSPEWMLAARREYMDIELDSLDDDRLLSLQSRLKQLGRDGAPQVQWLESAAQELEGRLLARRVEQPLDPQRLAAVAEGWRESRGTFPPILAATPRPEGLSVSDQTTFGINALVPRYYFVESHVMADPRQLGSQAGTQMRREALRFWVEAASRQSPTSVVKRENAASHVIQAVEELQEIGMSAGVLLLNLDLLAADLEELGVPVAIEKSWRMQAAMVADFQMFGSFFVTPVVAEGGQAVQVDVVDGEVAQRIAAEEAWTQEGDWAHLDGPERILQLRDRVHVRILEEYALKVEEPSAARVILISNDDEWAEE